MNKLILILSVLILISCIDKHEKSRVENWKTDIEFLKTELPERHCNLFFSISKDEFNSDLTRLSSQLSSLSDIEIITRLMQIITKIGDTHTGIHITNEDAIKYNIEKLHSDFYWFKDGIYFTKVPEEYSELLGKKIIAINGFEINQILDSLSTVITFENIALLKQAIPALNTFHFYEYFNITKDKTLLFEMEDSQGKIFEYEVNVNNISDENVVKLRPDSTAFAFSWSNQGIFFKEKYFREEKTYFVQYNNCWSREKEKEHERYGNAEELPSFKEFEDNVFSTIENNPIEKFIFDLRFNSGGSSLQGRKLIEKLSECEKVNERGKLFVILGRRTFSSAIINAMNFKNLTKAIFVGEETSGSPNHYGEVKSMILPKSGLIVNYSTKYIKTTDENIQTLKPDINIELSYSEYMQGIDPVYNTIIEL